LVAAFSLAAKELPELHSEERIHGAAASLSTRNGRKNRLLPEQTAETQAAISRKLFNARKSSPQIRIPSVHQSGATGHRLQPIVLR